ncbi:MAG: YceI family protein [Saprospiraceae bacterium]
MRLSFLTTALVSLSFLFMSFGYYSLNSYEIGEDYAVKFSTSGAEGTFSELMGKVDFDPTNLEASSFDVSVATASIETGNKTQNKHARSDNWLDAEAFPRISFVSTAFAKTSTGYTVSGNVKIHGVSQRVSIPFTFNNNVFEGSISIPRADYDIDGPFLFGSFVGDDVEVSLRVPVK